MAGGIGGVFLVAVFGLAAVCGAVLLPRLYRAGSAAPAAGSRPGRAVRPSRAALAAIISRLRS
jgi:hypothetical protein